MGGCLISKGSDQNQDQKRNDQGTLTPVTLQQDMHCYQSLQRKNGAL